VNAKCPRKGRVKQAAGVGYIKTNFFDSLGYNAPAVTMLVVDWREFGDSFDWKGYYEPALLNLH
jgi:hypothetical protein